MSGVWSGFFEKLLKFVLRIKLLFPNPKEESPSFKRSTSHLIVVPLNPPRTAHQSNSRWYVNYLCINKFIIDCFNFLLFVLTCFVCCIVLGTSPGHVTGEQFDEVLICDGVIFQFQKFFFTKWCRIKVC